MKKMVMTAVLLAVGSGPARAGMIGVIRFNELDVNRDDALTMTEAGILPDITFQWRILDKDGDGRLNRGEYAGYKPPAPAAGRRE